MSYGENKHFEAFKLPVTWTVLAVVGAICVVAAILFLGDRRDPDTGGYGNQVFDSVAGKPDHVASFGVQSAGGGTNWLSDYFYAVRENRRLRQQVADLSQYRDLYTEEKDLNRRYQSLLKLRTEPDIGSVTARSILLSRGPFSRNRLIDAGTAKGIAFGNPVITEQGLVGRVVGVSPDVSRVLMITDLTSHVPVMILRTDARAMLDGDGGDYPKLNWVRGHDSVRQGDQILTSGDGGVFPRGLPVGEAVKGVDGVWRVKLYANRAPVDFVKVLLFKDFSQLPNADVLLRSPPPSTVLPKPPMPQMATPPAGGASSSQKSSAPASSAPKSSAAVSSASASTAAVKTPASASSSSSASKAPVKPKPAPSSASSSTAPELKPFVPAASSSSSAAPQGQR